MKTTKKSPSILNVPIKQGEISVVLSDNADKVMAHSCRFAGAAHKAGLGVLLINCGMSDRAFRDHAGDLEVHKTMPGFQAPDDAPPQLVIHTAIRGDLICQQDAIDEIVSNLRLGVVIISGWEWTSASWRRKEALLYYLRELMEEQNVSIIIYSQARTQPVRGEFDRGGLGKLAMIAFSIIRDDAAVVLERVAPLPLPIVTSPAEWEEAGRSAQLLANKINALEDVGTSLKLKAESVNEEDKTFEISEEISTRKLSERDR